MNSLITEKSMDELHQDALKEDIQRTEAKEALEEKKEQEPEIIKEEVVRIEVPLNRLLDANRNERKIFFSDLIKQIRGRIEIARIQRSLKNENHE